MMFDKLYRDMSIEEKYHYQLYFLMGHIMAYHSDIFYSRTMKANIEHNLKIIERLINNDESI